MYYLEKASADNLFNVLQTLSKKSFWELYFYGFQCQHSIYKIDCLFKFK